MQVRDFTTISRDVHAHIGVLCKIHSEFAHNFGATNISEVDKSHAAGYYDCNLVRCAKYLQYVVGTETYYNLEYLEKTYPDAGLGTFVNELKLHNRVLYLRMDRLTVNDVADAAKTYLGIMARLYNCMVYHMEKDIV